jgi:hypothetical protein
MSAPAFFEHLVSVIGLAGEVGRQARPAIAEFAGGSDRYSVALQHLDAYPSVQPGPIERTIKVPKKIQGNHALVAGTFTVTPATLAAMIPGGTSYWNSIQVERIDVWGSDGNTGTLGALSALTLTVQPNSSYSQPPFVVTDNGTSGAVRARVGVRLGLLDRARWFGVADTTPLATISGDGTPTESIIIQASVVVISP